MGTAGTKIGGIQRGIQEKSLPGMEKWRNEEFSRARSCQRVRSKKHDLTSQANRIGSKFKEDSSHTIL